MWKCTIYIELDQKFQAPGVEVSIKNNIVALETYSYSNLLSIGRDDVYCVYVSVVWLNWTNVSLHQLYYGINQS